MRTIRQLNREFGITVVLITHYMDEAAQCDRVVVMDDGKILFNAAPKEVFSHVKALHAVGLDVPQAAQLADELIELGVFPPAGCDLGGGMCRRLGPPSWTGRESTTTPSVKAA